MTKLLSGLGLLISVSASADLKVGDSVSYTLRVQDNIASMVSIINSVTMDGFAQSEVTSKFSEGWVTQRAENIYFLSEQANEDFIIDHCGEYPNSAPDVITVPAGTFKACLRTGSVESDRGTEKIKSWTSKSVPRYIIKRVTETNGIVEFEQTLDSYIKN